ncbi:MAG: type III pantothenate kinase [Acidimicrobiia bacterium]|nr:type III pantothenate kinase [Acidimicrobiia bacterium]NNF68976.1 type III pantothenate kinase [Acidimicrobiia bacterium]
MLLTIDVGNTNTVLGLYDGHDLKKHWRVSTDPHRTVDEHLLWLRAILQLDGYDLTSISGWSVSSVVPAVTGPLRDIGHEVAGDAVVVVGPGTRTGMSILIDNPHEVGADRVVNSVAGRERYGAPLVVVDFGTSTNFDVVGPDGSYLGGVIAPGLELSTDALVGGTAALRRVEYVPPRSAIGKGTVEAIQSGALYGHAGLVDGIMDRLADALGAEPVTVATGGLASTIVPHCSSVETIDEFLTLDGLRMIFDMNREDA